MIEKPVFKAHLRTEVLPGEGVLVLSEEGARALYGSVYESIVPLMDGTRTADAIVDALAGTVDPARIYYALALLEKNGYVAESAPEVGHASAAFWHGIGAEPRAASASLRAARIAVTAIGMVDTATIRHALAGWGITALEGATGDLHVVVADDYLADGLRDINAAALASGRPWLVLRAVGHELWVGPLYVPGKTGCHQCLYERLKRNRVGHQFLMERNARATPGAQPGRSATMSTACELAAIEIAKHLAGASDADSLEGRILTLEVRTWNAQRHTLTRDPDCPACGTPSRREPAPIALSSRPVGFTQDGGHRSVPPQETLEKYQHLIGPITGVVRTLVPVQRAPGIAHVYMAGHNHALAMGGLDSLKRSLRNLSSGKGMSDAQAKASALCEAIERFSGEFRGNEYRTTASYREMASRMPTIHPNDVMRFSDAQYRDREAWNARKSRFNRVPDPLDEDARIDWSPAWSLTHARHAYLPTQLLYYHAKAGPDCDTLYSIGCSNGCASGNNLEEAILQGFFELVERDAVALWWYNRLAKSGVDIASFEDPHLVDAVAHYARLGRDAWALDLTSDLGIPVYVAVSRLRSAREERILFGFGCHLDSRIALQRAFAEMGQMLGIAGGAAQETLAVEDNETVRWLRSARVAEHTYLIPSEDMPCRRHDDHPVLHRSDLLEDIDTCRRIVESRGLEMLVLDQTRAHVGMPVVKVIVPGLRHFWARYAPGRLYDVPVQMGWLKQPLREEQLNPVPIFI